MSESLPPWPGEFTGHLQMDCDLEARNTRARLVYWESRCRRLYEAAETCLGYDDISPLMAAVTQVGPLPAAVSRHGIMEPDDSPQAPLE